MNDILKYHIIIIIICKIISIFKVSRFILNKCKLSDQQKINRYTFENIIGTYI